MIPDPFKILFMLEERRKKLSNYYTIKLIFYKNKDITEIEHRPISFQSQVSPLLNANVKKIDNQFSITFQKFVQQIEESQQNSSDWVLDHFIHLDSGK